MPKSATLTVPSRSIMTFCGFISRWIIPRSCAWAIAFAICFVKCSTSRHASAPRLSIYCRSVMPSTSSMTMYSIASLWLTSYTATIFG